MLRRAAHAGSRAALAAFGLSKLDQPSVTSVGIPLPNEPGLPAIKGPSTGSAFTGFKGFKPPKAGSYRGEPADAGRQQQSSIDRAFQSFDDRGATSSMPEPGATQP